MRGRLPAVVIGIALVGIGAALACGFPSVQFAPDDSFVDGDVVEDGGGSSGDGEAPSDDGGAFDASSCKGDPVCDCDGDGDLSLECDGGDCDDHDDRVRSTQTSFVDAASSRGGDWNCDSEVEVEADGGVVCTKVLDAGWAATATPQEIEAACDREGFVEDPGCGESGLYNLCEKAPPTDNKACRIRETSTRARGCR